MAPCSSYYSINITSRLLQDTILVIESLFAFNTLHNLLIRPTIINALSDRVLNSKPSIIFNLVE